MTLEFIYIFFYESIVLGDDSTNFDSTALLKREILVFRLHLSLTPLFLARDVPFMIKLFYSLFTWQFLIRHDAMNT